MIDLPFDLLINISDFCSDKESLYIALSCSDVYKLFNNRFAKTLKYKNNDDIFSFIDKMCKYSKTIKSIQIDNFVNPQIWIPYFPNKILLNCSIHKDIDPYEKVYTEHLYILNFSKCSIMINFAKFPYLKTFIYKGCLSNKIEDIKNNCKNIQTIELFNFHQ